MAIRVLIERVIEPGQEVKLQHVMMQLRSKAMQIKGYISGETLRALNEPNRYLAISNWNSVEEWKAWEASPERKKIQEELKPVLRGNESCTVYVHL
jgi:heme oxygenase (mycobilin-producing)